MGRFIVEETFFVVEWGEGIVTYRHEQEAASHYRQLASRQVFARLYRVSGGIQAQFRPSS